jgi:sugar-specific transcriptional regulator TrmB
METKLTQSLTQLGCTDKECRFFLACFKLGSSSIADIASKARLQRSTAYLLAEQLTEKGLLMQDYRTYNKLYTAVTPQTLVQLLETKKRRLGRLSTDMQENIATLENIYAANESIPVVNTYHGPSGLISVWKSILGASGEILLWTNQATEPRLFASAQHSQFIAERLNKGLPIRVLAIDNREGRSLLPDDSATLRQTRLLPPEISFSAETYLYDDKIAILDYHSSLFGLIITNPLIHEAQKSVFEMVWEMSWRRAD